MQENGCGESACMVGDACVPASFSTPYPKFCLKPSSCLTSLPSRWAPADLHAAAWGGPGLMTVLVSRMDLGGATAWAGVRGLV